MAVGASDYGECDVSGWRDIAAIAVGSRHTVGLKKSGTVVAVGSGGKGQTDIGEYATREERALFGRSPKMVRVKQTPWKLF